MRQNVLLSAAVIAASQLLPHATFAQHLPGPVLSPCNGKVAGAACSVENGNEPYSGVCTALPNRSGLACLPPVCAVCGDGFVTPEAGEQCDPGSAGATAACNINCTASVCGDGIVNSAAGEQCDPGTPGVANSFCNANCTIARCGDGIVNTAAGEVCDQGGETRSCTASCKVPVCGDGIVTRASGEECDDRGPSEFCTATCQIRR